MARAFAVAAFVVGAADLSEGLTVEGEGEVVEELAQRSGGLVADVVVHNEARPVHSRNSAMACSRCTAVTVRSPFAAAAVRA